MREPVKPDMGAACIAALPTPRRHSVHAQRRRVRPLRSGRRRRTRSSSNLSASASGSVNRGLPPREVPTRRGCSIRRARKSAAAPLSVLPRSDEPCLRKKVANHSASCRRNESRSNSARRRRAAWRVKADLRRSKVDNRSGVLQGREDRERGTSSESEARGAYPGTTAPDHLGASSHTGRLTIHSLQVSRRARRAAGGTG
mmetsp:Transcript_3825/g.12183  ORF Transcript_3825/g.12183 Transcript_3825/m.12183 type:complete len:200 (+) Transcript_3825:1506-2105(+)